MATTSEEDLQRLRDENLKLHEQIRSAREKRAELEADQHRAIEAAQLQAEQARLQAELEESKSAATATSVKKGAVGPLQQARDAMARVADAKKAALAEAEASETPVSATPVTTAVEATRAADVQALHDSQHDEAERTTQAASARKEK